jgi:5'-3' exonuclease
VTAFSGPLVVAVDGNSLVHRSFHAVADPSQPAWAVRGILSQLVAAVDRLRPDVVVIGFDDPDHSWRRETWPQYKANRPEKLGALVDQLAQAVAAMRELGVAVVVPDGLEADDVLAAVASHTAAAGGRTVVVTSDRDAFALITESTSVLRIINGGVDASPLMTPERLVLLLGVRPGQYRDYAALRGDPSDNLPGVPGIGPTLAARLLRELGTAAAAFADLDAVAERVGPGVAKRLACAGAREAWELNCRVMTPRSDFGLDLELSAGPGRLPLPEQAVADVYAAYGLTWTAREAAAVLAYASVSRPPRPVYASAQAGWTGARPQPPRLLKPSVEQLSLF